MAGVRLEWLVPRNKAKVMLVTVLQYYHSTFAVLNLLLKFLHALFTVCC